MTLAPAQRRRRPVVFRSADVLAGASVVVPAGTVVRVPAGSLDFSGYNTLSIKAALAGMVGADRFAISLDTVDPESAAGAVLASSLGRTAIISGAVNGNVAGTLYLPDTVGGGTGAVYIPTSDITAFGTQWGVAGGAGGGPSPFGTTWENVNTIDDYTSYAYRDSTVGSYTYKFGVGAVLSASVTGWVATWRAIRLFGTPVVGINPFTVTIVTDDGTQWDSTPFDAQTLTDAWTTYTAPLTVQAFGAANHNSLQITASVQPHVPPLSYMALTYVNVAEPGGTVPVSPPFFRNVLQLDASASANPVTVSALRAQLTNA